MVRIGIFCNNFEHFKINLQNTVAPAARPHNLVIFPVKKRYNPWNGYFILYSCGLFRWRGKCAYDAISRPSQLFYNSTPF
jgi:hypothetical protein